MDGMPELQLFVGVDIAATTFTFSWRQNQQFVSHTPTLPQSLQGWTRLQELLSETGIAPDQTLIVMEATGSYWIALATHLVGCGYHVSVINPHQAHHFAKALLKRQKTDAIDAQTLAQLAAVLRPTRWTPPPAIYQELRQRLAQRESWIVLRRQLQNQLQALEPLPMVIGTVRSRLVEVITLLGQQIRAIELELKQVLSADHDWAPVARRLQTIPGVGLITAGWLLTTTLNFTLCESVDAATAYAGLAPREHRSGTSIQRQPRIGHTGNRQLRTALYLATMSAIRFNPAIKAFYQRLRAKGKAYKVARCAAARKLLHLVWAVATKGVDYNATHGQPTPVIT